MKRWYPLNFLVWLLNSSFTPSFCVVFVFCSYREMAFLILYSLAFALITDFVAVIVPLEVDY